MMRLEEWPSSTEFGLQARLREEALIFLTGGEGLSFLRSEKAGRHVDLGQSVLWGGCKIVHESGCTLLV